MDLPIIRDPLPAFCHAERDLAEVSGIVVHYVSAVNVDHARRFSPATVRALLVDLNRPASARTAFDFAPAERQFGSYHFLIGRHGGIRELVPLPRVAWHAGVSAMHGREGCNEFCVGISLIATHDSGFTASQYTALARLTRELMRLYAIDPECILGHEHVARPRGRKPDPGPRFDWSRLHAAVTEQA